MDVNTAYIVCISGSAFVCIRKKFIEEGNLINHHNIKREEGNPPDRVEEFNAYSAY